ncbi:uncharacterized protein LOC128883383 [Hylaeus volcanicus]|uniref:uncharacterized protein LOC128883383 n=1 Tax=Hylaeus volcanicus TaxID=313075 RepID=UPI0023B87297|nr:uncharacterized protein LOC128883383 [Hylaeus volcanicus]
MGNDDPILSSIDTPLPQPRSVEEPPDVLKSFNAETIRQSLLKIFQQNGITLDEDAVDYLLKKAFVNGTLVDSVIDHFYRTAESFNLVHITLKKAIYILQNKRKNILIKVLDCFQDIHQYIWDSQNQKYTQVDDRKKCLIPDSTVYYTTYQHRYNRAVNRLKACPNIIWWSEIQAVQQLSLTHGERLIVRPAQCAKGLTGDVSVFGTLCLKRKESLLDFEWMLEDGSQSYLLDISKWKPKDQLYLDSNMVVITGDITTDNDILFVKNVSHLPFNEEFNIMKSDSVCQKKNIGNCATQLSTESIRNCDWLVFGICQLDQSHVISKIYNVLMRYDPSNLSGIILTGEFHSRGYNVFNQSNYVEGFRELFDNLQLWISQWKNTMSNKVKLVLVPGKNDAGAKFLPKFPLLEAMVTYPYHDMLKDLDDYIEIILGSNPAWFHVMSEDDKNQVDKSLVVCRHDLIQDIDIFKLALGVSFEQSLYPTSTELCKAIPPLIIGQGHLYPLPYRSPHVLRIAIGYDFMLQLSSLPNIVLLSDATVAYATFWQSTCWFCSPGQISENEYLYIDLGSNLVNVCNITY